MGGILFKNINILDPESGAQQNKFVAIRDKKIESISDEAPAGDFEREIDGAEKLMIPGFYNTHTHTAMTLMRGYGENLKLSDWLETRIFPFEDKLSGDDVYYGTLLAMAESFRFGIVSSTDMYMPLQALFRAYDESGAKGNISNPFAAFDESVSIKDTGSYGQTEEVLALVGDNDGRIIVETGLHAEYTATDRLLIETVEYAKEKNLNMHVHISETKKEHEESKTRRGGRTPTVWMNDAGFFESKTTAAHCVFVEEDDIGILAKNGVTIASNPVSNLKLASGVANIPAFYEAGINVGIGTDGVASNNGTNFLSDVKIFSLLNKERRNDPTLITPIQALFSATRAGALAQGREDSGLVKEGFCADLAIFDISGPHWCPSYEPANSLIYAGDGGDVVMTLSDGRIVYENGTWPTIDVEKVKYEVKASVSRILSELGQ